MTERDVRVIGKLAKQTLTMNDKLWEKCTEMGWFDQAEGLLS